MEINSSSDIIRQDESRSTQSSQMESTNTNSTTTITTLHQEQNASVESEPKKPSGSGPIPITMDIYHQLQQKRLLERQQQQQQQQQLQPQQSTTTSSDQTNRSESLNALEKIVNIVQATVPSLPLQTQPQQIQMPGPDLANIIFGHTSSVAQSFENDNSNNSSKPTNEGHTGINNSASGSSSSNKQHRKSTGGVGSSSQSQPRTTSPPTPVTGSASHKNIGGTKGPKAIHAIELIRIAAEILQFPPTTTGTALIYYHKYRAYLHQANKRGERDNEATKADEYLFATACLHLACKCTEVSRKVRDLVNVTYRVMNPNQPVLSLSTKPNENSSSNNKSTPSRANNQNSQPQHTYPIAPPPTVATYWHIRDSLLTTELMLLRILQFDLDVSMPFSDVLRIYKGMGMVFGPTDEEAAQLHPIASNFDVFLPVVSHGSSGLDSSQSKHGASSSSSSSSLPPHTGIHPTLSALVQISTTFCIDALCSSNIALNSSSRALAMGSIYLAIRSAGLELPLPFEEWCYAWGRSNIATGFGIQSGAGVSGNSGLGVGAMGSSVGTGVNGVNGIMGLTSGSNNLFVSSPRPTSSDTTSFMEGIELTNGGRPTKDSVFAQSPSVGGNSSPAVSSSMEGIHDQTTTGANIQQPVTIVDEVRKVVQELGSFYTH